MMYHLPEIEKNNFQRTPISKQGLVKTQLFKKQILYLFIYKANFIMAPLSGLKCCDNITLLSEFLFFSIMELTMTQLIHSISFMLLKLVYTEL